VKASICILLRVVFSGDHRTGEPVGIPGGNIDVVEEFCLLFKAGHAMGSLLGFQEQFVTPSG
jgi:hypothetical protein